MNHSLRAGLLALAGSILATVVYVEAQPLLQFLGGSGIPAWLVQLRIFLIPLITMGAAWAGHFLVTRDPAPPLPPGIGTSSGQPATGDGTPPPTKPPAG
jgi:hypothetical protein